MIRNSILTLMMTILCMSTAHAELYKCVNATGSTVYSDKPCDEAKKYKQQSLTIQPPVQPATDIDVGYSKFTRGLIDGYTGTFRVKDSIAHIKTRDKTIHVDLWLYPFRLNTKEIVYIKQGAIIGRGELKPVRFNFSFPASLLNNKKIDYEDIAITGLILDDETIAITSHDQWYKLTESIQLQYLPEEGKMSFVIKGKIDDYSVFINTKTYIYDKSAKPVDAEWKEPRDKPLTELALKSSVYGVFNYPYPVRPDLLARTPHFSLKDLENNTFDGIKEKTYDDITNTYSLTVSKPSKYALYISLENSPEFRWSSIKPGELYAREDFVIEDVNIPLRVDINMISLMHLTKPIDNNYHITNDRHDNNLTLTSPVEFAWTPLSDDTLYKCVIKGNGKPIEIDLKETNLTIELTPGTYHFVLSAYKDGVKTGAMRIHDKRSYRFDYVFKVKEKQKKI